MSMREWISVGLNWILVITLIVLTTCFTSCDAKYLEGVLQTKEDWTFLARFCFLSSKGRLSFEFRFPVAYEPQILTFYYDTADQWPAVYKVDMPCINKTSPPHVNPDNNQQVTLHHMWPSCSEAVSDPTKTACTSERYFRSVVPRWWYLALSRCNSTGVNIEYKIWMTNGDDLFHRQFSADEFYILEVDIAFLLATFLLCIISVVFVVKLRNRQMFHSTYKLFMVSIYFELAHLLVMCIAYGKYANDGLDMYATKTFGRVLESISILVFILMLILMAKGYTITRGRISSSGSIKIAVFMTLYTITYVVLFIYEAEFFDPGLVLYIYESPAGYGLIALRIIAWIWFIYAIFFTLKNYPKKNKFYYPFCFFYSLWFWCSPIIILIANFAIAKNSRESVVNGIERAVAWVGFAAFLFLTRPSNANKNFPYHVRTSQICAMTEEEATAFPQDSSHSEISHSDSSKTLSEGGSSWRAAPKKSEGPNFTELFTVTPRQNIYSPPPSNSNFTGYSNSTSMGLAYGGIAAGASGWKPSVAMNETLHQIPLSPLSNDSEEAYNVIREWDMSPRIPEGARDSKMDLTTFNPRFLASSYADSLQATSPRSPEMGSPLSETPREIGDPSNQTPRGKSRDSNQTPREMGSPLNQNASETGSTSRQTPGQIGGASNQASQQKFVASSQTAEKKGGPSGPTLLTSIGGNSRAMPFGSSTTSTLPPINPFITRPYYSNSNGPASPRQSGNDYASDE